MNFGKTLFAQLMEFVPWSSFARIVAYAQLTWRESQRDVEAALGANPTKLYAMGLRQAVRRATLADANERRDWRIWADFAAVLIRRAPTSSMPTSLWGWMWPSQARSMRWIPAPSTCV